MRTLAVVDVVLSFVVLRHLLRETLSRRKLAGLVPTPAGVVLGWLG